MDRIALDTKDGEGRPSVPVGAQRDRAAVSLASRQHGCISRRQLIGLGYSESAISRRLAGGILEGIGPGVYLFGPSATDLTRSFAAVLRLRQPAWVSHWDSARAWQLGGYGEAGEAAPIHLTVDAGGAFSGRGLCVHAERLAPRDRRSVRGLPVISPALTLFQLAAAGEPMERVERATADALARRLATRRALGDLLTSWRGRCGAPTMREVLAAETAPSLTRSEAEARLLALIRAADLPTPETNVEVLEGRYEVDLMWRELGAIVEVDSYKHHDRDPAFEKDRLRDGELSGEGWRVMRVTWRQIVREPERTLVRLTRFLFPRS